MHAPYYEFESSRLHQIAGRQHVAEAFTFRFVVASDQHLIRGRRGVQLIADFPHFPAETLDGFDAQVARRLLRGRWKGRDVDAGKLERLLKDTGNGEQTAHVADALQVMFAL